MKRKRKLFQTPEEYEAWKKRCQEVRELLESCIAKIDEERAARKQAAG